MRQLMMLIPSISLYGLPLPFTFHTLLTMCRSTTFRKAIAMYRIRKIRSSNDTVSIYMYEVHRGHILTLHPVFDSSYYKPGGPVFLYIGGETSGESRFSNLQTGSECTLPTIAAERLTELRSYSNPYGKVQWSWCYSREPVLWTELSIQHQHHR
jgi:hypothetical protein